MLTALRLSQVLLRRKPWCPRGFHVSAAEPETKFYEIKNKESGELRQLAYKKLSGPRNIGVVYVPGFMAHKGGGKPLALHSFCQQYGFPFLRYDPSGLGESKGMKIVDASLSGWLEDAKEVLLNLTEGPQIVVCSSMGAWISCLLIDKYPEKFAALVMMAPAINFHIRYERELRGQLTPTLLKKFEAGEVVKLYAPDYGEFPLSKKQFEDMKGHTLTREPSQVPVTCPTRIIHSVKDKDVLYEESLELQRSLQTDNVHINYLKHARHTLQDEVSLDIMFDTILKLASQVEPKAKL